MNSNNTTGIWAFISENSTNSLKIPAEIIVARKIFYCGLFPAIILLGLTNNIMTLLVFLKERFLTSTKLMLILVNIVNLFALTGSVFNTFLMISQLFFPDFGNYIYVHQTPYFSAFYAPVLTHLKMMLIALLSIERLLAVFKPLRVKTLCTLKSIIATLIALGIVVVLASVPNLLVYYTYDTQLPSGKNVAVLRLTDLGKKKQFYRYYLVFQAGTFMTTSFVIVLLSTLVIVASLSKRMQTYNKGEFHVATEMIRVQERKITRSLAIVTTFFIVCMAPMTLLSMYTVIDPKSQQYRFQNPTSVLLSTLAYMMSVLESSFNMFLYVMFTTKYRLALRSLFVRKKPENVNISFLSTSCTSL